MNTFEQAIGAGETISFPSGRQFLLLKTTSAVDVRFFNPKNNPSDFAQGVEAGFKATFQERFLKVEITSAVAQSVKVGISDIADCSYDRSVGDVDADVIPGDVATGSGIISVPAGSWITILAADSSRRFVHFAADENNVGVFWVNHAGAVSQGLPFRPGESMTLETSGAMYAHNPNAVAVKVFLYHISRS